MLKHAIALLALLPTSAFAVSFTLEFNDIQLIDSALTSDPNQPVTYTVSGKVLVEDVDANDPSVFLTPSSGQLIGRDTIYESVSGLRRSPNGTLFDLGIAGSFDTIDTSSGGIVMQRLYLTFLPDILDKLAVAETGEIFDFALSRADELIDVTGPGPNFDFIDRTFIGQLDPSTNATGRFTILEGLDAVTSVPIPLPAWLLGMSILAMGAFGRKTRHS